MKDDKTSLADIKEFSRKLANIVKRSGYLPEHVLYIERAGLFPGIEIANFFNCNISGIYANRSGRNVKSNFKLLFQYLPRKLSNTLLKLELYSNIHKFMKTRNIFSEDMLPSFTKNILIVDDAVDTGLTLKAVVDFLIANGFSIEKIKTAVLTTTRNLPEYKPDISLFKNVIFIFPWSYISKEFDTSWALYDRIKSHKSNLCKNPGIQF